MIMTIEDYHIVQEIKANEKQISDSDAKGVEIEIYLRCECVSSPNELDEE